MLRNGRHDISPLFSYYSSRRFLRRRSFLPYHVASCQLVSDSFHSPVRSTFHLSLTVLVHYRSLVVFSLGRWSSRFPTRFHLPRRTLRRRSPFDFAYGAFTLFGRLFQWRSAINRFCNSLWRLGWSPFARRYLGNRSCFLFLRVLRCFNSPRSLCSWQSSTAGLPHSEISGSLLTYSSPKLIVVRHVLHRLLVPRHSPHASFHLSLTVLVHYRSLGSI